MIQKIKPCNILRLRWYLTPSSSRNPIPQVSFSLNDGDQYFSFFTIVDEFNKASRLAHSHSVYLISSLRKKKEVKG
ncbi:unnamed protein product [Prunus brigantina]